MTDKKLTKWSEEVFDRTFKGGFRLTLHSLWIRDQRVGVYPGMVSLSGLLVGRHRIPCDLEIHDFDRRGEGNDAVGELAVHDDPSLGLSIELYDSDGALTAALRQAFSGGALVRARLTLKEPITWAAMTELSSDHHVVWSGIKSFALEELYGQTDQGEPPNPLLPLREEIAAARREAKLAAGLIETLFWVLGIAVVTWITGKMTPGIEKSTGWNLGWVLWPVGVLVLAFYINSVKRRIMR